jgi:hypothetical protein
VALKEVEQLAGRPNGHAPMLAHLTQPAIAGDRQVRRNAERGGQDDEQPSRVIAAMRPAKAFCRALMAKLRLIRPRAR